MDDSVNKFEQILSLKFHAQDKYEFDEAKRNDPNVI